MEYHKINISFYDRNGSEKEWVRERTKERESDRNIEDKEWEREEKTVQTFWLW